MRKCVLLITSRKSWGKKSDIKILRTLLKYPTKEFNENELAMVSEVGQKTVNRAMPKYVNYGVVNVRTVGKANIHTLNSGHYIVEQLGSLFQAEEGAKLELKRLLKEAFRSDGGVISLAIFGSIAKGEEEPTSDIDVFILTRDKEGAKKRLEKEVMGRFGNVISEYILTPKEFEERRETPAVKEIVARGEFIVGRLGKR
ncbi:MAG: nucleotidyltransferase domain-containing protein [Candidatus Hodarchaeaceae archaeon]|nr:nucleotidyltransferase domain-containing protein [Candidatus Hodarchaeaceae archaeon]